MNCTVCAATNVDGSRFCVKCGAALISRCPACSTKVEPGFRFCPACGGPLLSGATETLSTPPESARMAGSERRQVSILFGDFSEFTSYSTQLDPEDLRDTLKNIWANLDTIITAHGGTPEKHSGDAVMAVFGGWKSREEDPAQAVRAALAMQAWLADRKDDRVSASLRMRIAVHTGVVIVGPS